MRNRPAPCSLSIALGISVFAVACSGGGGGGGSAGFQLPNISIDQNEPSWQVNREIGFTFSQPVDFSTVSLNTISIQTSAGAPATGTFFLQSPKVVVFQPNCPTRVDLSDTGLQPGGVPYVIRVLGRSSGSVNTVRSTLGEQLAVTQVRNFVTSDAGPAAFLDTRGTAPDAVVRPAGSSNPNATYLEIGGDTDNRVYFERDNSQALVLSVPGFEAPINLYSDPSTRLAVVIEFDQAIDPSASNVSSSLLRLEFLDGLVWRVLETKVSLVANCTETGARVRLEPIGILPQGSQLRAVVLNGFRDLVGQETSAPNETFAIVPTRVASFPSLSPDDVKSDEFNETFDFGGTSSLSFQDTNVFSDSPIASWKNGKLTAAFSFAGTGGPGGAFDWLVQGDDSLVLDTDAGLITAADGVTTQLVTNGIVDLRNMTIEAGGAVRVQGSKPLQINATGTVIIRGTLDLSGFAARDVQRLNSGDSIEAGGAGGPGGGRGGNANEIITSSTPRGSFGQGPFPSLNAGGQGGESGFAPVSFTKDGRRPGGGAGGRFALAQGVGLTAESGFDGAATAVGAVTGVAPPRGGALSAGPFVGTNVDDFFGTKALGATGNVTGLIRGELVGLLAGYGGGGGGNADPAPSFPTPNWTAASDEKGGAGGGGGGGVHIRALGPIQFGAAGQIKSDGGRGGIGENILGQDHIGGNGGSGSGGHIILETATRIDFTDAAAAQGTSSRDWVRAVGAPRITGAVTPGGNVSFGGAGGPGVIQLHVPRSLTAPALDPMDSDIVVPIPALGPGAIDAVTSPPAVVLVPAFSARSIAVSKWISIGGADQNPGGIPSLVQFLFQGIETTPGADEGKVLVSSEIVQELPALVDEDLEGNANVTVQADRLTLRLAGASLSPFTTTSTNGISNDIYLRTPTLLENFILRLSVNAVEEDFHVARAAYDEGLAQAGDESLSLTVADEGMDLQDFINANTIQGVVHYQLLPRFFAVATGGQEGALPSNAYVRIRFQATGDNGSGSPDENNLLVDWTGDISQFNSLLAGELQFFRFDVEFELNAGGGSVGADTQPVTLDFLRIPFEF